MSTDVCLGAWLWGSLLALMLFLLLLCGSLLLVWQQTLRRWRDSSARWAYLVEARRRQRGEGGPAP
jgi:cell division protein FtsX